MSGKKASTEGFGSLLLLFLGIPLLVLSVIGGQMASRFQEEKDRSLAAEQEAQLDDLISRTVQSSWAWNRLGRFQQLLRKRFDSGKTIAAALRGLRKQGLDITLLLFRNGKPVRAFPASSPHQKVLSGLYQSLGLEGIPFRDAQRRLKQPIFELFGPGHRPELLKRTPGCIRWFRHRTGTGAFLWRSLRDGRGWFI